jgi:putative membrane protein
MSQMLVVLGQAREPYGHMWGWDAGWMWAWMLGVLIVTVVLVASLIWVLARVGGPAGQSPGSRARDLLDERYARGEIATDEYRERLNNLRETVT